MTFLPAKARSVGGGMKAIHILRDVTFSPLITKPLLPHFV